MTEVVNKPPRLLLFGASGAIGSGIHKLFVQHGWQVVGVTRAVSNDEFMVVWDPVSNSASKLMDDLSKYGKFDAVCWAQGTNLNDSIYSYDESKHAEVYETNVKYILNSLSSLIRAKLLQSPARLCVVSSIWQDISRQNKLSYAVSKSALKGLVLSLANDMATEGHLVNAVLPGALDTPMTRKNLSTEQLTRLAESTQFGYLPKVEDVAKTVLFLCSSANTAVTGQFIKVDFGYSDVRIV